MENQLLSISKIFNQKLFRIPDYQRGYAWTNKQLIDFWNDLSQLAENSNHYAGVLTLEIVLEDHFRKWEDDIWIIESKDFEPYYVVDGQQRLTTVLILIKSIIETVQKKKEETKIIYFSINEITKRYIFDSKDEEKMIGSFLFSYDVNNPNQEYLKSKIFLETPELEYKLEETIYTRNLLNAKNFFLDKLEQLNHAEIEKIFKKITQHFLFNIYSISKDIDVFVTFETMNNRGKKLSNLELLKNRLIYLSMRDIHISQQVREKLRKKINDTWKAVYHYLGRNSDNPLKDDDFLNDHFTMYYNSDLFGRDSIKDYIEDDRPMTKNDWIQIILLEKVFSSTNINLQIKDISSYAESIEKSIEVWYFLFNPFEHEKFSDEEKILIDLLNKLEYFRIWPMLIVLYYNEHTKEERIKMLTLIERISFFSIINDVRMPINSFWGSMTYQFFHNKIKFQELYEKLNKRFFDSDDQLFEKRTISPKIGYRGFYHWNGIRYFLFEYDKYLKSFSKSKQVKIDWRVYSQEKDDFVTVEHIIPQKHSNSYWKNCLALYKSGNQRENIINSLGNLLPLSQPKNSSLQNDDFKEKVSKKGTTVGYRFGCYAENEITAFEDWTVKHVIYRGIRLLKFMEIRWGVTTGNDKNKLSILGLDFLIEKENLSFDINGNIVENDTILNDFKNLKVKQ